MVGRGPFPVRLSPRPQRFFHLSVPHTFKVKYFSTFFRFALLAAITLRAAAQTPTTAPATQPEALEAAILSASTLQPNPPPITAKVLAAATEKSEAEAAVKAASRAAAPEVIASPTIPAVHGGTNTVFTATTKEQPAAGVVSDINPPLPADAELDAYTKERARIRLIGDFEAQFRSASVGDVIRALAEHAQMRYIAPAADALNGSVSIAGTYNILDLLDVLQEHYGARLEYSRGIWRVSKAAADAFVMKTYSVKHNNREEVDITSPTINTSSGSNGGPANGNASGGNSVSSAGSSGGSSSNGAFKVSYSSIEKDVADLLSAPSPSSGPSGDGAAAGGGKVKYIPETGDLFVLASKYHHELVKGYLAKVDQPLDQIEFSAYFVESSRDPQRELGINWRNGINISASGEAPAGGAFTIPRASILSNFEFAAAMKFTAQDSESSVVQNPSVLGLPNRKTVLDATTQVPYAQSSFNVGGNTSGATSSSSVERLDIGTIVNIFPIVRKAEDGAKIIRLHVSLVVSSLIGEKLINGNPVPVTARRRFEFSAEVTENETLAIGGLVSSSVNRVTNKVPFLGDVPIAGRLFRADSDKATRSNMMVYITPRILRKTGTLSRIIPRVWPEDPAFERPAFSKKTASLGHVRASLTGFSRELSSVREFSAQGREPTLLADRLKGLRGELEAMSKYVAGLRQTNVTVDADLRREIASLTSYASSLQRELVVTTRL